MGLCLGSFGTTCGLDLGFSPVLPSVGFGDRPEGGDKYIFCGLKWKYLQFPTAAVGDAMGLKVELWSCIDPTFPGRQPLASHGLSSVSAVSMVSNPPYQREDGFLSRAL